MNYRTKKMVTVAMLCAMAYVLVLLVRIPLVLFLKYEPKDVIITIGGLIFGPLSAFVIGTVSALIELLTISSTGIIGFFMNVIASAAFACSAAFIYKRRRTLSGAVIGLAVGCALMTGVMLLWNYLVTPIFLQIPRKEVVPLLYTAILPFNLIKGGLNAALTMFLYKPVILSLRKSGLVEATDAAHRGGLNIGVILVSLLALATFIMLALVMNGAF